MESIPEKTIIAFSANWAGKKATQPLARLSIFFIGFSFLMSCGGQGPATQKDVLHLFQDAERLEAQGAFQNPSDRPITSVLTYPHQDTLWYGQWHGKPSLRFESHVQGSLRGSLHLLHRQIGQRDFELELSTWLDVEQPEAWSGILFWMSNHTRQALGVRWKASGIHHRASLEFFTYREPHLKTVESLSFPLKQSQWADVRLIARNGLLQVNLMNQELLAGLQDQWHLGNFIGLFQGFGTGYFADLSVYNGTETIAYDDVLKSWNQEMVNTTRKLALEHFTTPDDLLNYEIPVRRIEIANEWRRAVPVHAPSRLRFETTVPGSARLHVGFAVLPPFALSDAVGEFSVSIDQGNGPEQLAAKRIHPRSASSSVFRYHDFHLDLSKYAWKSITITLQLERLQGDEPLLACWSEPIVASSHGIPQPNVMLVMLDTLRADRVGVYGNPDGLTPTIDQVAAEGTTFLNTIAQAPWTTPSHASLFTSLYPNETGADNAASQGNVLHEAYLTLAEIFQRQGFNTAAFTNGLQVRGELGFHQGFDRYLDIEYNSSYSTEAVLQRAQEFIGAHEGEPWFLFLHTYAVHFPYEHKQFVRYRELPRNWRQVKHIDRDAYDGGVRFADEWVGSVIDELKRHGEYDSTLLIIASDHGEDLGERGMPRPARHGHGLFDEQIKVPLIMRLPGLLPRDTSVDEQVRLLDLMPTILQIMQWQTPAWSHGRSLLPLLRGQGRKERVAISEGLTYGFSQIALRTRDFKLIKLKDPLTPLDSPPTGVTIEKPQALRLFHLSEDPQEKINVVQQHPEKLHELNEVVLPIFMQNMIDPTTFTEGRAQEIPQLSPSMLEALQAHGYMGDG